MNVLDETTNTQLSSDLCAALLVKATDTYELDLIFESVKDAATETVSAAALFDDAFALEPSQIGRLIFELASSTHSCALLRDDFLLAILNFGTMDVQGCVSNHIQLI